MNYSQIPPYTSWGSYSCNVGLGYLETWIKDSPELIMEPDFQRGHVWNEQQQVKYVEHVLKGGRSGLDILCNCYNFDKVGKKGPYELVDGLQRVTACLRFLRNEIGVFCGIKRKDFTGQIPINISLVWHVNQLKTRAEVLQWYLDLNSGGTIHSDEELSRVRTLLMDEVWGK